MKTYPTAEQLQALREGLRSHPLAAMFLLALDTGMRRDELRQLTWSQVNLQRGVIQAMSAKAKAGSWQISLLPAQVQMLTRHLAQQLESKAQATPAWPDLDLVFPDREGEMLSISRFLEEWSALCQHCGVPQLRFHDLRVLVWRGLFEQRRAS